MTQIGRKTRRMKKRLGDWVVWGREASGDTKANPNMFKKKDMGNDGELWTVNVFFLLVAYISEEYKGDELESHFSAGFTYNQTPEHV